jgi:opacity protein-like surface antigen
MFLTRLTCCALLAAGAAFAQSETLEVGAIGGFGMARDFTITSPAGSAKAGFSNGPAIGAFFGGDSGDHWGGEVRYLYRFSNLRLSGTGGEAKFDSHTHIVHGDILAYFKPRSAKVRPFIAFGGGVKGIFGTGIESAAQPLGRFAGLTNTHELLAMADVGAGIKYAVSKNVRIRVEVRDYMSKRPNKVIAPAPGTSVSGFLNDIVASASVSYSW